MKGLAHASATGKKFKIVVVIPTLDRHFSNYCFHFIDQGASFYHSVRYVIVLWRTITQQQKLLLLAKSMSLKALQQRFFTPTLALSVLDPHVLNEWKSRSLSLPKWNEKFLII
jgi:hypothetical protein